MADSHHTEHVERVGFSAPSGISIDRLRWGPIVAGLFVALAVLAVLATLGAAIGFSSVDYGDEPRNFGIGAGIWGAISALIAFFVGGLVAARTAATPVTSIDRDGSIRNDNGLLQGAMVWAVAVPLSMYLAASTAGSMIRGAGSALSTGVQATATASQNAIDRPESADRVANAANGREAVDAARQEGAAATQQAGEAAKAAGEQLQGVRQQAMNAVTPENVEATAEVGAKTSWGLLASMLLGLGASAVGGLIGGKSRTATVAVTR